MSRQPIIFTIAGDTLGWTALSSTPLMLRHVQLIASGDDVLIRRTSDGTDSSTIGSGDRAEFVGVDLAQIEVDVPANAELRVLGSPF